MSWNCFIEWSTKRLQLLLLIYSTGEATTGSVLSEAGALPNGPVYWTELSTSCQCWVILPPVKPVSTHFRTWHKFRNLEMKSKVWEL
jgi:hypothetical protein